MTLPKLCGMLLPRMALVLLLAGCASAINVSPPDDATHIRIEDISGNVLYDGKAQAVRLPEHVINRLPTNDLVIKTTRGGKTVTENVRIDSGNLFGDGATESVVWNPATGKFNTKEEGGMTQIDPPTLSLPAAAAVQAGTTSVLTYAGDPAPSGSAEHVTVTDSAGNTLHDAAYTGDEITVLAPADGKLFISTRWTEGRTRQELVIKQATETGPRGSLPELPPNMRVNPVSLRLNDKTRSYDYTRAPLSSLAPADAARGQRPDPLAISKVPVLGALARGQGAGAGGARPDRVTIADGAGRTLYSGPPSRDGVYDVDATDGKLVIATAWTDGRTTRQEISYTDREVFFDDWDEFVLVTWDEAASRYTLKPAGGLLFGRIPLVYAEVSVGNGKIDDKPPTIGVIVGPDEPLHRGPDKVDAWSVGVGLGLGRWGRYGTKLTLAASRGDDANRSEAEGVESGWSYQAGDSPELSPGLSYVGGTRSRFETEFQRQEISLTLSDRFRDEEDSDAALDYRIGIQRSVRDYDGYVELFGLPAYNSTDSQKITQYDLSAGIGVRGRRAFPGGWRVSGGAFFDAIYYHGDYDGDHHYHCPTCGPGDVDFTQSTSDSDSGLTWGARLTGRVGYLANKQSEVFLGVEYEYQDEAPQLRNRTAPGDEAPHLYADDTGGSAIRLGFTHAF